MKDRIDHWMFESFRIRPEALAFCRMFYAAYLLFFVLRRTDWIADFPALFYNPPLSIARLFHDFPPHGFFYLVNVLSVVLLVMLFVGYRTRVASIGFTLLVLIYSSFAHSLGKIDHMVLFTVTPLVLSFSNWGAAWSMDAHSERVEKAVKAWPLAMLAIIVGFTMSTSGWWKAGSSWLDPSSQAIQSKLIHNFFARDRVDLLAPAFLNLHIPWIWEVLDWFIVGFEVLFFFAAFHPRAFRLWIYFAVAFHLMVLLILNIDFSIHMTVFIAFFPFDSAEKLFPTLFAAKGGIFRRILDRFYTHLKLWMLIPFAALLTGLLFWKGSLFQAILSLGDWEAPYFIGLLFLGGGFLMWTLVGGLSLFRRLKKKGAKP